MAWFDVIPDCKIREDFESIITNFAILHQNFCKVKNINSFVAIANTAETILQDLIEAEKQPPAEVVASFVTVLRAQQSVIKLTKDGHEKKDIFDRIDPQITQGLTLLTTHTQEALRILAANKEGSHPALELKAPQENNKSKNVSSKMTTQQILDMIESLKLIPDEDNSLRKIINRAFFRHRLPTFFALGSVTAAAGSGLQTGLNVAVNALTDGITHCETALECVLKDPRFYVPATLFTLGAMGFSYALCKSSHRAVHETKQEQATTRDIESGNTYRRLN